MCVRITCFIISSSPLDRLQLYALNSGGARGLMIIGAALSAVQCILLVYVTSFMFQRAGNALLFYVLCLIVVRLNVHSPRICMKWLLLHEQRRAPVQSICHMLSLAAARCGLHCALDSRHPHHHQLEPRLLLEQLVHDHHDGLVDPPDGCGRHSHPADNAWLQSANHLPGE